MLKIFYCTKCHDKIQKWGEFAVLIYEQVCEYYVQYSSPLEVDDDIALVGTTEILSFLEKRHYIVTVDCGISTIKAKPLGYISDGICSHMFCVCNNCS